MKTWIVSGVSAKSDGLLVVVDAETQDDAYKQIAKMADMTLVNIYRPGERREILLVAKGLSDEEIQQITDSRVVPRYHYTLRAGELEKGKNINDAIQW